MSSSRQSLKDLFSGDAGTLSRVVEHARLLARLDRAFRKRLSPALRDHCRVANLRGDTLVIAADSPVWASRIRYESRQILRELAASCGVRASEARILVRNPPPPGPPPAARRRLSAAAAGALQAAADAVEDPELAAALRRLADRADTP